MRIYQRALVFRDAALRLGLAASLALLSPVAARCQTVDEPLLQLLRVLREQGAITEEQYEQLRRLSVTPEPPRAGTSPDHETTQSPNHPITQPLDGPHPWYQRFQLRGYTQFRFSEVLSSDGVPLEMPSDRSVNANESMMIRRGRFILGGNVTNRLSIYAQSDFNASTGAADLSLQMRDLYADIALDQAKTFRVRLGQSKVPFGFINLQSSQQRGPFERPDALNFALEGERDLGAYLMWAPANTRSLFADLVNRGLKGSGDYGVVAIGAFGGQGPNRPDQNGEPHWVARASYPFTIGARQIVEFGVQGYTGKFVTTTQAITVDGAPVTPSRSAMGERDERVAVSAVWYPQPFGVEAEWNWGRGPQLSDDAQRIGSAPLNGGSVQAHYRRTGLQGAWMPFARWQYYDGGRKFARNAPHAAINEGDVGVEFSPWTELKVTAVFTHTFERNRTNVYPYTATRNANRLGVQVQWNY